MMRRMSLALICAAVAISGCAKTGTAPAKPSMLMIANFNTAETPNLLGGDYGSWDRDPEDETQGAEIFFEENLREGSDYSLGINYDVDSPNPAFNGFWMHLGGADFSSYENLCFSIMGDSEEGFTEVLKLELKNAAGESGNYNLRDITGQWQEVRIPLNEFRGLRNLTNMSEFVIVFEDAVATQKTGTIYIDDVYVK